MAIPNDPVHFEYLGGYRPPTQTKTKSATATTSLKPPAAEVASTKPKIMDTAKQLAMTPSYAEQGGTTFVLKEKILLKEVQTTSSTSPASNIQFPGVNSTVPTLIG
jgi:hypothetical protein